MTAAEIQTAPIGTLVEVSPNDEQMALARKYGCEAQPVYYLRARGGWTTGYIRKGTAGEAKAAAVYVELAPYAGQCSVIGTLEMT